MCDKYLIVPDGDYDAAITSNNAKHAQDYAEEMAKDFTEVAVFELMGVAKVDVTWVNGESTIPKRRSTPKPRPFNGHRRWTQEEDKRLAEMYKAGESYSKMALEFGRTEKAIEIRTSKILGGKR